jgi:hypothetical protein
VTRSLKKNFETVPGKHSIDSLQKTAILGTSHIIRKVLQCKIWSLSSGDYRWFKRSTRQKRPVTRDINNNNNNNNKLQLGCHPVAVVMYWHICWIAKVNVQDVKGGSPCGDWSWTKWQRLVFLWALRFSCHCHFIFIHLCVSDTV